MQHLKKTIGLILACLLVFSVIPVSLVSAYNVGDIVEYGRYPQTLISDVVRIEQFQGILENAQDSAVQHATTNARNVLNAKYNNANVYYDMIKGNPSLTDISDAFYGKLQQVQAVRTNVDATYSELNDAIALLETSLQSAMDAVAAVDESVNDSFTPDAAYVPITPTIWKSYGYSSGTGDRYDGLMTSSDYMMYYDFTHGTESYRAVRFTSYRPYYVGYTTGNDKLKTYQDDNNYSPDQVYFFHYEPLKWRVINPSTGLILCDSIIDAQPYESVVFASGGKYYTDSTAKNLANDYKNSTIHKWIIRDFFDTAFTKAQQSSIPTTLISFNDGSTASERVFLPSMADVSNENYGFGKADVRDNARKASGTDYAKCQGLYKSTDSRNANIAPWWLRDSDSNSAKAMCVSYDGKVKNESATVDLNYVGVRPACYVNNLVSEAELCKFCGKQHGNSFIQRIIAFFHRIFAFIRRTDINMG